MVNQKAAYTAVCAVVVLFTALPISAQITLTAAGATFPAPIYQKWFSQYQSVDPKVQINYQPIGSGGGIKNITEGLIDFGASDGPMTDAQINAFKQRHGFGILQLPTVLGADVPAYNVPGVNQDLNFTPEALAGIFLGHIKTWNDAAIASANPGVHLPNAQVVVVHRSDGSGTTYCWTDYLSKISPEWRSRVGRNISVDWPVGIGGKGNPGVSALIKEQSGAIGYVELIYAVRSHLCYGRVKNSSGHFIKADLESVTAAAASVGNSMPSDFRVSITDPPAPDAYPISTFTWLLVPERVSDPVKRNAITGFLRWALTTGQNSVESLEYAKLPAQVVAKEEKAIALIQ